MNIGLFTDSYYPEISGLVTSIDTLRKELKKRGHKVYIFTTSNPGTKSKYPSIFRLPSTEFIFLRSRRLGLFYSPRAAKCVKRLKLDIIHTQTEFSLGIFAKIMAKQLSVPIVHTYHTLYKDYVHYISKDKFKRFSDDVVRILSRNFCNGCNTVIAPSLKVYDLLIDYGVKKPIKIIPTGIELDRFQMEKYTDTDMLILRKSMGIDGNDPVILFIGRVAKEKSIDLIIRQMPVVLKRIPNAKCLIVGDGPSKDNLMALAKELKIQDSVIFAGEKPWDQIGKYYRLGNIFISPSATETQGLTLIEAMASDIPVVARNDRNIDGFIQNDVNGRIFCQEDELPGIIIDILTNKDLAMKLVSNARKTVYEYSAEQFGKNIEKLYNEILEHKPYVKKRGYSLRKRFKIISFQKK